MFLWTRPITGQILSALLTSKIPSPDWSEWKEEGMMDAMVVLPLALVMGQLYVRIAASFSVPKPLRKICPPAIYTLVVQCTFADVILAALLQSVVGRLDFLAEPVAVNFSNMDYSGPFSIFTCRLLVTCIGLYVGEAFFPLVLTGGIACGKSTFSKQFQDDCGFRMIDADKIGHLILLPPWHGDLVLSDLVSQKDSVYVQILEAFGSDDNTNQSTDGVNADHPLLTEGDNAKTIDRAKLGARIFGNPDDRKKLNAITHKKIFSVLIKNMVKAIYMTDAPYVCAEVPLLFESGSLMRMVFGLVLCVACSPAQQLARLQKRNPELKKDECQKRIDAQMPMADKVRMADIVLWNDKDFSITSSSAPSTKKTSDKEKAADAQQRKEQELQHSKAMEVQMKKAMQQLEDRINGSMGISLTKMILLMSGSMVISACYKPFAA